MLWATVGTTCSTLSIGMICVLLVMATAAVIVAVVLAITGMMTAMMIVLGSQMFCEPFSPRRCHLCEADESNGSLNWHSATRVSDSNLNCRTENDLQYPPPIIIASKSGECGSKELQQVIIWEQGWHREGGNLNEQLFGLGCSGGKQI